MIIMIISFAAAAEGHVACLRVLIRSGARLCRDRWNNTAIADALNYEKRTKNTEAVRLLRAVEGRDVGSSADTSTDRLDPELEQIGRKYSAMIAAANGNVQSLRQLLTNGLDVNMRDYDRRTPLMVSWDVN